MEKLFGLKIKPLDGSPERQEWVSVFADRIPKRIATIQRLEGLAINLFEQIESDVIVNDYGLYQTSHPKTLVRITIRDTKKCHGWLFWKSDDGRLRKLQRHAEWYLNGEPEKNFEHKILHKVTL